MSISVVVPVRNEEDSIHALLDALLAQTRPPDEIVLTDGGSTDSTIAMIESFIELRDARVRLIRAGAALPGRGRNLAAAEALCEWLAFTDAGNHPAENWLAALVQCAENENADVVYGAWEPVTDTLFEECAAIAYVPPPILIEGDWIRPPAIVSALMRREVWRAAGGFPEHLRSAEDLLFMKRVEEAGFRIARAPRALVRWHVQPTFWRTFRRFVSYSRHNILAGLWTRWQAAIFRRYALLLVLSAPALWLGPRWLLAIAALWLILLAARAVVALRRNRRAFPASPWRNALRLLLLVPLIATLDAAALVGTLDWLLKDKLHLSGEALGVGNGA
ncbi:MAG TPA: glycosyltransferase [Pyrinomonadaceae bacterium]|jgi:glycosyltransferase involved in cell wall biosynthesis